MRVWTTQLWILLLASLLTGCSTLPSSTSPQANHLLQHNQIIVSEQFKLQVRGSKLFQTQNCCNLL